MAGNLVIGADAAGTQDLIVNNETGLLYESGNYIDLADKMEYALCHRDIVQSLAKKGQEYMLNHMTAELNASRIYEVYQELLPKN